MALWTAPLIKLTALSATLLASGLAMANARIDPLLNQLMVRAKPTEQLHVVVSFKQSGPVRADQVQALKALGIQKGITMRTLPIAGVYATPARIKQLAKRSDVVSIYYNKPLKYFNREQRQISGAARVLEQPALMRRSIPYTGKGVTVVVNDSGIDTNNPDLPLGTKVVDNVQAAQNIAAAASGILPITHLRNQVNTDIGSGHGTHCAGTVAGTGASSNGLQRGAAPGADLVGYGSGGVLLILDAVGGLDFALTQQFAYRNPIRVVSNSWGSSGAFDPTDPVSISTYELAKQGIVSVFAAGNDGPGENTHNPYAQAPWVISVGAGEKDGVLTSFSSRGKRDESKTFTMPDGETFTYYNEPTIVASGVNIVSTRAITGALPALAAQDDAAAIPANQLAYYTLSSGTSMATPHVSGVVALMLEANPNLTAADVKTIIKSTATNMTGRATWEVGAGHLNAYAAVAMAAGLRTDYGATTLSTVDPGKPRRFTAKANVEPAGAPEIVSVNFAPAQQANEVKEIEVAADVVQVSARITSIANPVGVSLIDNKGNRYDSGIALPVLGDTVAVSAPGTGEAGKWKVFVRGLRGLSGVNVDPTGVTNGVGAPETFDVEVSRLVSKGFEGIDDTQTHPARRAIEAAISQRLMDSRDNGRFQPDEKLTRGEMATYLVMGANVRQSLPFNRTSASAFDVPPTDKMFATVEAVLAGGGVMRDLQFRIPGLMALQVNAQGKRVFNAAGMVSHLEMAQALVKALGTAAYNAALNGAPKVTYTFNDGAASKTVDVKLVDANGTELSLSPVDRGYLQQAVAHGILVPKLNAAKTEATLSPRTSVTRADYAVGATGFAKKYRTAEDGV